MPTLTKKQIHDFLQTYQLMAVATFGDFPWIANVYYAVDEHLNLYFLSNPERIHSKHIIQNPLVACSIYDSTQAPKFHKKFIKRGIQISGEARVLTGDKEVEFAIELWKKTLGIISDEYSVQGIKNNTIDGRMFVIKPTKIKMFDEELFDEDDVPMLDL